MTCEKGLLPLHVAVMFADQRLITVTRHCSSITLPGALCLSFSCLKDLIAEGAVLEGPGNRIHGVNELLLGLDANEWGVGIGPQASRLEPSFRSTSKISFSLQLLVAPGLTRRNEKANGVLGDNAALGHLEEVFP